MTTLVTSLKGPITPRHSSDTGPITPRHSSDTTLDLIAQQFITPQTGGTGPHVLKSGRSCAGVPGTEQTKDRREN